MTSKKMEIIFNQTRVLDYKIDLDTEEIKLIKKYDFWPSSSLPSIFPMQATVNSTKLVEYFNDVLSTHFTELTEVIDYVETKGYFNEVNPNIYIKFV